MPMVNALIALDNFLIDRKVLPSYHVYMVCEKTCESSAHASAQFSSASRFGIPDRQFGGTHG